jgi:opacity protein-like surface antigen
MLGEKVFNGLKEEIMKTTTLCALVFAVGSASSTFVYGSSLSPERWSVRLEFGGTFHEDAKLSLHDGPVTGGDSLELRGGYQMNFAAGYRIAPWMVLEGELGFSYNEIETVGNWYYPYSSLTQFSMMANLVFEPPHGPLVPFAGIGVGGVYSTLSFGSYYYYYYSDTAGWGTDFVPAAQVFAGLRYEFSPTTSVGLSYRCLATDRQKWHVNWWTGNDFEIGVDRVVLQSISLSFTAKF